MGFLWIFPRLVAVARPPVWVTGFLWIFPLLVTVARPFVGITYGFPLHLPSFSHRRLARCPGDLWVSIGFSLD